MEKNQKCIPEYAKVLGKGKFAGNGTYWQCSKCGAYTPSISKPGPRYCGSCPGTATGNHMWVKA